MRKGAIFRGQRMVNWSPVLQTAVSDLEVWRVWRHGGRKVSEISSLVGTLLTFVDTGQVEYSDVQGQLYYFKQKPQASQGKRMQHSCTEALRYVVAGEDGETEENALCISLHPYTGYTMVILSPDWLYSSNSIHQGQASHGVTWCHLNGRVLQEFIPVATTRPETILGDSAVCVHPEVGNGGNSFPNHINHTFSSS